MTQRRSRSGRYAHSWAVVDRVGDVEQCQTCGAFRQRVDGTWRAVTREQVAHLFV